jgi:hypothetical protein
MAERTFEPGPPMTLGNMEAATEREAIAKAAEEFNIAPALRNKIVVTKLSEK